MYVLEVSRWHGDHWSDWCEVVRGEDLNHIKDIANREAKRLAYNWRARIIQIVSELST